ncbi:MAG: hypothetical protein JXR32_11045 [Anaerolineaceae bacterium]|nr:hypothetical protein [Anaerolineaceae bacterium]
MKRTISSHKIEIPLIIMVVLITLLACGTTPTGNGLNVETQVALTLEAISGNIVVTKTNLVENAVDFNGITFKYDPSIAQSVSVSVDPGISGEMGESWFDTPQSERFDFVNYITGKKFHNPVIMVFSVEEYISKNPNSNEVITKLQQYIANQPNIPDESIPFLPNWNAGQVIKAMPAFINFQNGKGIRYLTEYAQYAAPLNNYDLFYTFQGITDDGKYYISAILPVTHPSLPADSNVGDAIQNQLYSDFDGYKREAVAALEAQPLDSFTPDLNQLDAMIQSFKVH